MKKKSIMGLEYKWEVLLVYLIGILGFIFSFMKDKKVDKDVKFQYNQSGTIFIINFAISIISRFFIRSSGILFISYLLSIVQLVLFVFAIITIVKAFQDETYEIPYISNLAKSIVGSITILLVIGISKLCSLTSKILWLSVPLEVI